MINHIYPKTQHITFIIQSLQELGERILALSTQFEMLSNIVFSNHNKLSKRLDVIEKSIAALQK